ncbi:MAG: tetratricopeptide repeat protein [Deltaproteobacteria bacterium]|jgi:superkiller protein 3|nr:tetratricopeptide repeat protein [Deltaproteobacteria bacterium]MCL5880124.1 tetratricopeptide repeat protein [Deltaproteobacteria bacterium]MDA8304826.1 tetratricopeptide repeat protein [Deltaproteobacteria bacterium]
MFKLNNRFKLIYIILLITGLSAVLYGCGLSQVSETNKLKSNLYYRLGAGYYQNGNYVKAMQEFIKAKASNPYSAKNFNAIGMVYMMTHREGKAIINFKRAISLDPKFSDAYYNLALIYIKKHNYKTAKINLKMALKNPFYNQPYNSYTQLARIYIKENKLEKAKKLLLISESLDKGYFLTYYYLGEFYFIKGRLNHSLFNFQKALSLAPFFSTAKYKEGVIYFKLKKYNKAKLIFDSIYKQYGSNEIGVKSLDYLKKIKSRH